MSAEDLQETPTEGKRRREQERTVREKMARRLLDSIRELEAAPPEGEPQAPEHAERLLRDAFRERASDIHLDPQSDSVLVRFRIDGVVLDVALLGREQGRHLINQFKTLAEIDPVTTFAPEEARFTYVVDSREINLRVALAPCICGDKLTVRVLDPGDLEQRIERLGMAEDDMEKVELWLGNLSGMFLVTGPTGSGKTTTLYSLLHELKLQDRNVVTVEDPIEYQIDGINQIQVNRAQGLTFANGIQAMLRLDPDHILVGEMRDPESASVAVDASVSGRGVMSTLHSRDAVGSVSVLRKMGVSDPDIAATLSVVAAQRLVRKLCSHCREQAPPTDPQKRWLELVGAEIPDQVWHERGCEQCRDIGYVGRTGVFEVWHLSEDDYQLILDHTDERTIRRRLAERGQRFLLAHALAKAADGTTTLDELRSMPGHGLRAAQQRAAEQLPTEHPAVGRGL